MKFPPVLKISLLLNLLLLALAARLWLRPFTPAAVPPPVAAEPARDTPAAAPPHPFRWSQLESTNYLTYIANLRAIGCPAQTIRDLITADVDSLYAPKREQISGEEARSGQNLESRRQALAREESDLIARLLGFPVNAGSAAVAAAAPQVRPQGAAQPPMPLVFTEMDTNFIELNDTQREIIARMRRGFADELGGAYADPSSEAYAERWRKAQPDYDEMLQTLLGQEAYVELQRETARPVRTPGQAP